MSGTPVDDTAASAGSIVDNLLGQLIFLGVEPHCSRGDNGDAFWEREISSRWREKDPEALEVVHDLFGQIMMRHSKAQTMRDGSRGGEQAPLVPLPRKTEELLLLPLGDPSERAVYGELERICREDVEAAMAAKAALARATAEGRPPAELGALRKDADLYRKDDLLTPRDLQLAATHVASLTLDAATGLEKKLAARALRARALSSSLGGGASSNSSARLHSGGGGGGASLLRELTVRNSEAAARVRSLLASQSAQRCAICLRRFGPAAAGAGSSSTSAADAAAAERGEPRLSACAHLFCTACLVDAKSERGDDACPACFTPGAGLATATRLHTPLDASAYAETDEANGRAGHSTLPKVEAAPWDTATPPPAEKLAGLRVWRCDGGPCHDASHSSKAKQRPGCRAAAPLGLLDRSRADAVRDEGARRSAAQGELLNVRMERSCTVDVDGLHLQPRLRAEAKFKRALTRHCSVCGSRSHGNDATYWEEREVTDKKSGRVTIQRTEKWLHPVGVENVRRGALGKPTGRAAPTPTASATSRACGAALNCAAPITTAQRRRSNGSRSSCAPNPRSSTARGGRASPSTRS